MLGIFKRSNNSGYKIELYTPERRKAEEYLRTIAKENITGDSRKEIIKKLAELYKETKDSSLKKLITNSIPIKEITDNLTSTEKLVT